MGTRSRDSFSLVRLSQSATDWGLINNRNVLLTVLVRASLWVADGHLLVSPAESREEAKPPS